MFDLKGFKSVWKWRTPLKQWRRSRIDWSFSRIEWWFPHAGVSFQDTVPEQDALPGTSKRRGRARPAEPLPLKPLPLN
jgi:hypothetical protein